MTVKVTMPLAPRARRSVRRGRMSMCLERIRVLNSESITALMLGSWLCGASEAFFCGGVSSHSFNIELNLGAVGHILLINA